MGPRRGTSTSLLYLPPMSQLFTVGRMRRVLEGCPIVEIGIHKSGERERGDETEDDGDEDCHGADEVEDEEERGGRYDEEHPCR